MTPLLRVPKLLCLGILVVFLCGLSIQGHETESLETECRPFVEKALKEQLEHADPAITPSLLESSESQEGQEVVEEQEPGEVKEVEEVPDDGSAETEQDSKKTVEEASTEDGNVETQEAETQEIVASDETEDEADSTIDKSSENTDTQPEDAKSSESEDQLLETTESIEQTDDTKSDDEPSTEESQADSNETVEEQAEETSKEETGEISKEEAGEISKEEAGEISKEETEETSKEETSKEETSKEETGEPTETEEPVEEEQSEIQESSEETTEISQDTIEDVSVESQEQADAPVEESEETKEIQEEITESIETPDESEPEQQSSAESKEDTKEDIASKEDTQEEVASNEDIQEDTTSSSKEEIVEEVATEKETEEVSEETEAADELAGDEKPESIEETDEDELTKEFVIPEIQRPRNQLIDILHLDEESSRSELALAKAADVTLRELKRLYDTAIKPLEILYKYRDLSNRHFGDPEIFSKPLILFMGPWSGGKSSIINYLLDNEYNENSLRTGAEPSPAYFNIVTWGPEPEVLDGTQLAADWTFSGLQKFGQGLEDRLRGLKLPNKLLEMVNIVEIPGILEVRKQVSRVFPFNDACQWFIDRADIIFLVYDPSKLDVGPETEAILDQLKGREYQTRVILNKADTVKPEELLRVQGALLWNISPLMSSAQPPIIYTTSLWSTPYNPGSPVKLLQAQERAFLRDIRSAIDKRIDNKIASARRFAVRVRNHAKMVDCYLTTYYNHKTFFGNRKQTADDIIENPQSYHIYEGLSTLKNISRYDLPDPDTYRDFFKVNPLYDFQQLSSTCTYFKGCPINRLDVCIAYDLPELVGKHKKLVEQSMDSKVPLNS